MLIQSVSQRKTLWILPGAAYDIFQRGGEKKKFSNRARRARTLPPSQNIPPTLNFLQGIQSFLCENHDQLGSVLRW